MKMLKILNGILLTLTFLFFAALIIVVTLQILGRYMPFSFIWTEEASRYCFIFGIVFGAPLTMYRREFVRVDLILYVIPDKLKKYYDAVMYLVLGAFSIVFMIAAFNFSSVGQNQTSATLGIPMSVIYSSMTVSFALLIIYSLLNAYYSLFEKFDREEETL